MFNFTGKAAADESVRYSCEPALPIFCGNIHIGCIFPTRIATVPMEIEVRQTTALVWFADREQPVQAQVKRYDAMVIRLVNSRDWIRIRPDGQFAQRIYRKKVTGMAYGVCKTNTDRDGSGSN
jgi:hypothetical protein